MTSSIDYDRRYEAPAVVCSHVLADERPVTLILHHRDETWQMVCGFHDHPHDFHNFGTVHARHIFERQPNLAPMVELDPGWLAEWTGEQWEADLHDD